MTNISSCTFYEPWCACEQMRRLPHVWIDVFGAFGYINICLNPFIYASRYDVFKKSVRRILKKENTVAAMPA